MVNIRPFIKADRFFLRQICCDVADRGDCIENFFPDREFAADFLTAYYTDYEPGSSFVAESDGKMVGYVNGCLDNRRFGLTMMFLLIPLLLAKGLGRGVFWRKEFWTIVWAMLKNWRRLFVWRQKSFHSCQGHLHVGIAKDFRGQDIGRRLVDTFMDYARLKGVAEITAGVHDGNRAACRFFENMGFEPRQRYPMVMACGDSLVEYHSLVYVKKLV